jgi:hypothetical protein
MYTSKTIYKPFDAPDYESPERSFISAIINDAIKCINRKCSEPRHVDADLRWLFSSISDPYFDLIEMDPQIAREGLLRQLANDVSYRTFRDRYRRWKGIGTSIKTTEIKAMSAKKFTDFMRSLSNESAS